MEPWVYDDNKKWGVKTWGEWSQPDENKFLYVGTHKKALNNVQWGVNLPLIFPEKRQDRIISMISKKDWDTGHIKRIEISKKSKYIDVFGRENYHNLTNYIGKLKGDKKEFEYINYRYCLTIENNSEHNYATEKIWDGILCECLCFYWGCPNLEDYIDPEAFVRLDLNNIEESLKIMQQAVEEDWWSQRIGKIREMKKKIIEELGFFPTLKKIITSTTSNYTSLSTISSAK